MSFQTSTAYSGRGATSHNVFEFGMSITSPSDFGIESSTFSGGDKSISPVPLP